MQNTRRLLCLAAVTLPVAFGCDDRRAPASKAATKTVIEDNIADLREAARKEHAIENCKTIVAQFNTLVGKNDSSKPAPLSPTERDLLTKQLHLTDEELNEVARDDFSALDAHYLEECFFFYDAIRALEMDPSDTSDAGQLARADRAFAWLMRQVWRREISVPMAPPSYTLKRGSGSTPERAAAAMTLFQMLGLDSCLVSKTGGDGIPQPWAVGVRLGSAVYLFDPFGGAALTKPDGKGIYTLEEVKKSPDVIKPLTVQFKTKWEPKQLVEGCELLLTPSLSAMTPRMRFLQTTLGMSPPFYCGVDPAALAANFAKTGEKVSFWNPPAAPPGRTTAATPVLLLAYFFPPAEGGFDRAKPEASALEAFRASILPKAPGPTVLVRQQIVGVHANKMWDQYFGRFLEFVLDPNKPRQQIVRGQFDEATKSLIDSTTKMDRMLDTTADADVEKEAAEWARQLRSAAAAEELAKREGRTADAAGAHARVEELYKSSKPMWAHIERAAAIPSSAEQTYQLALDKHEQAERRTHRPVSEPATIRAAWLDAEGTWNQYLIKYGGYAWIPQGQKDHAKALQAEARREVARPRDAAVEQ